jgi:hypothetical protein
MFIEIESCILAASLTVVGCFSATNFLKTCDVAGIGNMNQKKFDAIATPLHELKELLSNSVFSKISSADLAWVDRKLQ